MEQPTLAARLRYAFDNSLSHGAIALVGWLALVSAAFIALMSVLVWGTGIAPTADDGTKPGVIALAWASLMRTLDAGTMGGDAGSWPYLFSMLIVTFGGIFVISTLIGTITSGIEEKLDDLRKGRSQVLESGHIVILGWSPQIFTVVSELVLANANKPGSCIVVLAEKNKVEMEDELRERVGRPRATRIVCRTGSPSDVDDIQLVNVQASRTIVILPSEGDAADAHVIKTLLAIVNGPRTRTEPYHVVAPIHEAKNLEVARLVGKEEAELVLVGDLLSRVTVQTCRQSGLSVVYLELLDFGGDEIYFHEEPSLVGKPFGDSLLAFEESTVIGIRPRAGAPLLNPPLDRTLEKGDKLIAISEDDDTIKVAAQRTPVRTELLRESPAPPPAPERTLILGWSWKAPRILAELDAYVAPGSEARVVAARGGEAPAGLRNLTARVQEGDPTDRGVLDALDAPSYDHIILLSEEGLPPADADARTLITLLHLRDIADRTGKDLSIVSEMLDVRNRALAEVTKADDFIVGERLISLLLSQIAENRELNAVFADLFDPEGSEIYLKPIDRYVALGTPCAFATVVEAARRRGEIAIGYRIKAKASDAEAAYGVKVNPRKSEAVAFAAGDRVIVVAED